MTAIAVTGHLRPSFYTHSVRPVLPTACVSALLLCVGVCPLSLIAVYKISTDCFWVFSLLLVI